MQIENRGGDAARFGTSATASFPGCARDARGNTLAIVGAALVPLAGMIGSGVDMSRAYMAKTRLQSACDAAALGRPPGHAERHDERHRPERGDPLLQLQLPPEPLQHRAVHADCDAAVVGHGAGDRVDHASRPRSCASSASPRCRSTSPATPR